jgi:hypothetical protein
VDGRNEDRLKFGNEGIKIKHKENLCVLFFVRLSEMTLFILSCFVYV